MKRNNKKKNIKFNIYLFLIMFASLFMSMGYAAISAVNLSIQGNTVASAQSGVFISDVTCTQNNNTSGTVNSVSGTMMNSTVVLSPSNSNSTVTCSVSVYNNTTKKYLYDDTVYDNEFYDNNNINFTTSITSGTALNSQSSQTFNVVFKYANGVTPSSSVNTLNSYLNFRFILAPWYESCNNNSTELNCKLITASTPNSDSGLSFSSFSSSSNGRGLYYTSDLSKTEDIDGDGYGNRVYYYRGNVTNNFVLFGNICWRVLRTNEDGTIRLIYGGNRSNGSCPQNGTAVSIGSSAFNSNSRDNAYVGYMYGTAGASNYTNTHRNTNNSTIKTMIDNWYTNNLASYSSYLADEVFCNDREVYDGTGYGTSSTYYMGYNRVQTNKSPSFVCNQENDQFTVSSNNGNGALTYPIGLITADELNFAGSTYNASGSTTDHFLYTGENLWTMTPADYYSNEFYVLYMYTGGNIRLQYSVSNSNPVRPVINLLANVTYDSGTGTYNNPYVITGANSGGGTDPDPPTPISELWYENCNSQSTTLNCKMITLSTPSSDSSISFSSYSSSSNGNGLYYTSDLSKTEDITSDGTGERVYYYRGAVTNNFVYFGGFCWRIVRTNEDGTVRLIYGGTRSNNSCPQNGTNVSIGSSSFNSSATDNAHVGYMYGSTGASNYNNTHRNTNNSAIKTVVDNWYQNNLTSYSSYLADEVFCNDRATYSGNGYGTSNTVYAGNNRLNSNKSPTLKCSQSNDKFTVNSSNGNGALTYPIGLITGDEMNYLGSMFSTSTSGASNHYLYTGSGLWTMTPSDYYSNKFYGFYMNTTGELRIANDLTTSYAVRPVINLLSTVVVTSGSGTYNSPFQLSLS